MLDQVMENNMENNMEKTMSLFKSQARRKIFAFGLAASMIGALPSGAVAADKFFVMASTTSTEQSGLFKHLLPAFTARTGIEVRVVAQGTGQALKSGMQGDADLLFVHDKLREEKFVADGFGLARRDVMYNDFVLIGPKSDPARIAGGKDVGAALTAVAKSAAPFASRGDKSGTHAAELRFWKQAGVDPKSGSGNWYRETGSGMGPTLNVAAQMNAYTISDRGTWLNFRNRAELDILVQGDTRLFNQYGVIVINPARHPHVKKDLAQTFADWIVSAEGQATIASYKIGGQQLFFPNAAR
jgi:tungstate transport system substrate-binding protein